MTTSWEPLSGCIKKKGAKAIVTGDIDNVHHRRVWKDACKKLRVELLMPLWDSTVESDSRQLVTANGIMEMEQSTGVKAILSCIDQRYFTEEWLGRQIDRKCIEDMQPLVGPAGKGIDVSGEAREYHSTSLDAPLFKQRVEIIKYTKTKSSRRFRRVTVPRRRFSLHGH